MELIRFIKDNDYGYSDGEEIGINIQRIWNETKNEIKFIKMFAMTYQHELLHNIFDDIIWEMREYKEEEIIRKLTGDSFDKKTKLYYKKS